MRKLFFLLVSVLFCSALSAQDRAANHRINSLYLLIGTLSDYMGRYTYIDKPGQVDRYHYFEKPLVDHLDSIIENDLRFEVTETFFNGRYETFSERLADTIKSFYENNLLKDSLFRTHEEICSFLAGRYYRYGEQLNDSIYKIQLPNSPDHNIIEVLLKRIGCTKIINKFYRTVPAQFIYYFIPAAELTDTFRQLSGQKKALSVSFKNAAVNLLGVNNDYEKKIRLKNEKDLLEIIELFGK